MGSPKDLLDEAKAITEAKQKEIVQVQQTEQKRSNPFKIISDLNNFSKTPIGGFAMEALGIADKKKQQTNNSPFGRTLASLRDNWTVFFLIPFALGTSMLMMAMLAVLFYTLMMKIMGMV